MKWHTLNPLLTYKMHKFWLFFDVLFLQTLFVNLDLKKEITFVFYFLWTYLLRDKKPLSQGIVQSQLSLWLLAEVIIVVVTVDIEMNILVIASITYLESIYWVYADVSLPIASAWLPFMNKFKTGWEGLASIRIVSDYTCTVFFILYPH